MAAIPGNCVAHLEKHFPHDRTIALLNDGIDLSIIDSAAFMFLYSFDAMVHFDLEIILSYIPEFSRVLKSGAYAFVHHSNYSANPGGDFRENPHWRNFMSAGIFKQQHIFAWGEPNLDCITVLRRNG